jgi:hypothetical protein
MIITKKTIPRRTVLRGMGVAVALPFLDGMVPAFASAVETRSPRRFGVVYVPNGMVLSNWTPLTQGKDFEFTPTLKPLEKHRDDLIVVSGTDRVAGTHAAGCTSFLTDVAPKPSDGSELLAGVSMDQLIANHIGGGTQLKSLEISLDGREGGGSCEPGYSCTYSYTLVWRTPTTPVPMEDNPRAVFERLFGDSATTEPKARRRANAVNRSILDSVGESASRLHRNLGPQDQTKLEEYFEAVRSVEQRIQVAQAQSERELPIVEQPAGIPEKYSDHAKLMFDLQVLAHQCDLTRVTTMMMGRESSGRTFPEIEVYAPWHPTSHHGGDRAKLDLLSQVQRYHVSLVSYYVDKLKATPDGDGSLFDHMLLLYGAGMSDPDTHSGIDVPNLLIAGHQYFRGGRHLRCASGTPRANLHLSIMEKFGMPIEKIGNSITPLTL